MALMGHAASAHRASARMEGDLRLPGFDLAHCQDQFAFSITGARILARTASPMKLGPIGPKALPKWIPTTSSVPAAKMGDPELPGPVSHACMKVSGLTTVTRQSGTLTTNCAVGDDRNITIKSDSPTEGGFVESFRGASGGEGRYARRSSA